jgi:hypothetical protein
MPPRLVGLLAMLTATAAVAATALGPGDPTTVFVDGFTTPCRTSFGPDGYLYVVDFGDHFIYRVAPDGTKTLFHDDIADPRSMAFDAFGYLLVAGRGDGTVWRVDQTGQAAPFLTGLTNPIRPRVGPNGDIWVAAVDSVYQFDAVGRLLGKWDVISQGQAAFGLQFDPAATLYITNWGGFSTLEDGIVTPVPISEPARNGAPHFDVAGNAYWIHESVDAQDTHRMILAGPDLSVTDEDFATFAEGPCAHVFGRDTDGTTNTRQFVSLRDGTIVEVNAAGVSSPGVPETGLELGQLDEEECADEILGQDGQVTDDELHFLDVIGNNDGGYDVGDFRAYLVTTGTID